MGTELQNGEYHQITITEWLEIKNEISRELRNVAESFVRIGYNLRRVRDEKLYEQDGYKNISEFAEKEYGLNPSTTSRFMAINERYSDGGYSKMLKAEYMGYGQSKLSEMLSLPEKDLEMITPQMQREDIRNLKDFNKKGPQEGVADDKYQLFDSFYKENPEIVKDAYGSGTACCGAQTLRELIIPSGNRTYRKGLYFVSFTEGDIKVKKFGQDPESISWDEFQSITAAIFAQDAEGAKTYGNHYGIYDEEKEDGRKSVSEDAAGERMEPERGAEKPAGNGGDEETGTEEFAPAQIASENQENQEKPEPEDLDMNPPEEPEETEKEQRLRECEYQISMKLKKIREEVSRNAYVTARVAAVNLAELLKETNQIYSEVLAERSRND